MDRRGFLKALGFGAAVVFVPFGLIKKEKLKQVTPGLEAFKAKTQAIIEPSLDYQIIVIDDAGNHMWAPKTQAFDQMMEEPCSVTFYAQDIPINRSCILVGAKLMNPDGLIIHEQKFANSIAACDADVMKLTYQLTVKL